MKKLKPILLVEDDLVDTMTVKKALKDLKVENELATTQNGEEALAWLEAHRDDLPGLILLDLNMPRMNGIEFLQVIKQDETFKMVPVVVLTTSEDQQDRVNSFKLSVAGYMIKSYEYPKFVEMMKGIQHYWDMSKHAY